MIDIETYTDRSGNLIPYAVGSRVGGSGNYIRNKADIKLYYLSDYDGEDNIAKSKLMMVDFLKHILNDNFIGYKFYAHNLGGFDGPLLIKYLADIVGLKIKPLMRNNELYSLDLIMSIESMDSQWLELNKGPRGGLSGIYNKGSVRIILQDSYKLLPLSLSELGKVFAVETQKGEFPHSFVKDDNLTYIGQSPCGNIAEWNLKETCLSYLTADLSCLYEVLINFDKMITYNYSLNFTNYLSIPSLCMATFRSNFLGPDVQIPKTRGKCESDIRKSYRGGIVSLFKPKISKG